MSLFFSFIKFFFYSFHSCNKFILFFFPTDPLFYSWYYFQSFYLSPLLFLSIFSYVFFILSFNFPSLTNLNIFISSLIFSVIKKKLTHLCTFWSLHCSFTFSLHFILKIFLILSFSFFYLPNFKNISLTSLIFRLSKGIG